MTAHVARTVALAPLLPVISTVSCLRRLASPQWLAGPRREGEGITDSGQAVLGIEHQPGYATENPTPLTSLADCLYITFCRLTLAGPAIGVGQLLQHKAMPSVRFCEAIARSEP